MTSSPQRQTAATWSTDGTVYANGRVLIASDTGVHRISDGVRPWSRLPISFVGPDVLGQLDYATGAGSGGGPTGIWTPATYSMKAWNFDPVACFQGLNVQSLPGALFIEAINVPADTITNIHMNIYSAGATLTSGQNFAALYQGGNLKAATSDQSTNWTSTGEKIMPLTSPQTVTAGIAYVAWYWRGTTAPAFAHSIASGTGITTNLNSVTRSGYNPTGYTTAPPSTLPAITLYYGNPWVGLS